MNAIDFLIQEHNKVRTLFKDFNNPKHGEVEQKKIFDTIHSELLRHEEMEHTVWYPYFKAHPEFKPDVKHLISEEEAAKKLLHRLDGIKSSAKWTEEVKKLQQDVEHHASEEEIDLFPKVREFFEEKDLIKIGKEMHEFKKAYVAKN